MNREAIIQWAREAGMAYRARIEEFNTPLMDGVNVDDLVKFAALVAAAEREACQKECDELAGILFCHGDKDGAEIAVSLRDAIRARGNA